MGLFKSKRFWAITCIVFFGFGTIIGYLLHGGTTLKSIVTFIVPVFSIGVVVQVVGMLRWLFEERKEKRVKHTNNLKKVIEQWIKGIPNGSTDIRLPNIGILTCYQDGINPFLNRLVQGTFKNHEMRLTIEDEYIFEDLLFHLDEQEPEIGILWNKYKEKCIEQYKEGKELVLEIAKELTEQIERETDTKQFTITPYGIETNSISEYYLNVIFHACIIYVKGEKDEFSKFYEDFESRTGHKDNTIGYSILDLSTGYITVDKGLLEEGEFKTKMDNMMVQMFEKAKTDYYQKGEKLVNLTDEIRRLEYQLKRLLRKQLIYQEFKGKCKYLKIPT